MNITEIKERKAALSNKIAELLKEFTKDTKVSIVEIETRQVSSVVLNTPLDYVVDLDVRI